MDHPAGDPNRENERRRTGRSAPRARPASPLHPSKVPTMPSNEVSLLLVDDDPSAIQVMNRVLAGDPNQRFATTGNDALQSEPALARVPVIFATSHDVPEPQVAALERGANDDVTKPRVAAQWRARGVAGEPGRGSCFTAVPPRAPDGAATPADRAAARPA